MIYLIGTCKANVEAANNGGLTALHMVCSAPFFNLEMFQYLVEQGGANIEATCNEGNTALLQVCSHREDDENQLVRVRYMVETLGASASVCAADGSTCLHNACSRGKLALVRYLFESVRVNVEAKDRKGATSLHYAVLGGHLETLRYMVETVGADVNAVDMHGATILHHACRKGFRTIAHYLLEQRGVDVNLKDCSGCTAFHVACSVGNAGIVERFLATNDSSIVEQQTDEGFTGLHIASAAGRLEVVHCLLEAGAAVDAAVPEQGTTALHFACRYGRFLVVRFLIVHGGDYLYAATFAAFAEATALHFAVCGGSLDIVRYLVETCYVEHDYVNVGIADMHAACMCGFLEIVQYFVQIFGSACINACTYPTGRTCLHSACHAGQLEIARYLLSATADRSGPANSIAATTATPSLAETMTIDGDLAIHMALHHYNQLTSASDVVSDNIGHNSCATKAFALVLLMVKHFPVN